MRNLNMTGIQELTKQEQLFINGGGIVIDGNPNRISVIKTKSIYLLSH